MMFNFQKFCEDNNIEYSTEGKNVTKGWINVQCPFCGDLSNHLGFSPEGNTFTCWKCGRHSIIDTISALLGKKISWALIKEYNTIQKQIISKKKKGSDALHLPIGCELLVAALEGQKHRQYLRNRGFDPFELWSKYDLHTTKWYGEYPWRIIIPIYYQKKLVSYTTRTILKNNEEPRYLSCPGELEVMHHKDILYNLDNCFEDWVVVVEGCFDVFRLGDNSCAALGTGFTMSQVNLLAKRFKTIFILFDNSTDAFVRASDLSFCLNLLGKKSQLIYLSDFSFASDPAEMKGSEVKKLFERIKEII